MVRKYKCEEPHWDELAQHLGWDGESGKHIRDRFIENWECLGLDNGQLQFVKRAGADGQGWPDEDLYHAISLK